jgi:hypothetical protein
MAAAENQIPFAPTPLCRRVLQQVFSPEKLPPLCFNFPALAQKFMGKKKESRGRFPASHFESFIKAECF